MIGGSQDNARWLEIVEDKDFQRSGGLSTQELVVTMRLTDPHHTVKRLERAPYTSSAFVDCVAFVAMITLNDNVWLCVLVSIGEQHAEHV